MPERVLSQHVEASRSGTTAGAAPAAATLAASHNNLNATRRARLTRPKIRWATFWLQRWQHTRSPRHGNVHVARRPQRQRTYETAGASGALRRGGW